MEQKSRLFDDSEIISQLVTEKFKNILKLYYYQTFRHNNCQEKDLPRNFNVIDDFERIITNSAFIRDNNMYKKTAQFKKVAKDDEFRRTSRLKKRHLEIIQENTLPMLDKYSTSEIISRRSCEDHEVDTTNVSIESPLNSSIGSCHASSLVSLSGMSYTSFLTSPINQNAMLSSCQIFEASFMYQDINALHRMDREDLIKEASAQYQIIFETRNALKFCINSERFRISTQRIEAERLLLLASQKRQIILKEVQELDNQEISQENLEYVGHLKIWNITFPIASGENLNGLYMVILNCGSMVLATEVTILDSNDSIKFKTEFEFDYLSPDFQIGVAIYALAMDNNEQELTTSHISRKDIKWSSPKKFFRKKNRTDQSSSFTINTSRHRDSSFTLCGTTSINIGDLSKRIPLKLWMPMHGASPLKGNVLLKFMSNIQFLRKHCSFLTIGLKIGESISWNLCWCCLDGHILNYWYHPSQKKFSNPIESIDLSYCVTTSVSLVERELCARPRTLILEIAQLIKTDESDQDSGLVVVNKSSYIIRRYYLSANTKQEIVYWIKMLNCVVSGLRNWNCTRQFH